jgi:hypothetical protein
MRFRKLRIAWSVGWGLLAVLLIVLWVRSYQSPHDQIRLAGITCGSSHGNLWIIKRRNGLLIPVGIGFEATKDMEVLTLTTATAFFYSFSSSGSEWVAQCPHWFLFAIAAVFAALPWINNRFSLRTLLIATTLVAVVLGLALYSAR